MKYKIIYADPPWSFRTYSNKGKGRAPERHYNCMTLADIQNLPVEKLADKDAVLFLWVTYPLLQEGLDTIKRWGFTYKTCAFSWIKKNKSKDSLFQGLGFYTRANNEICLLATRGKPLKRISHSVQQVVVSKIREHSRKPDEVLERIVQLFGDLPRIDLFARQQYDGWTCVGNQIDGQDIRDALPKIIEA